MNFENGSKLHPHIGGNTLVRMGMAFQIPCESTNLVVMRGDMKEVRLKRG